MPTAEDTALAFTLLQHQGEQAAIESTAKVVTVTRSLNPAPAKYKPEAKAVPVKPNATASLTHIGGLPLERGTMGAAEFMAAVKSAGKRLNQDGHPYTAHLEVRDDTIRAIHAFVGYDPRGNFGAQDAMARAKAMRELGCRKVGGGSREADRKLAASVAGAPNAAQGAPEHKAKAFANLAARAQACRDAIIDHEKAALHGTEPNTVRLHEGLAQLERNRLSYILTDLSAMSQR